MANKGINIKVEEELYKKIKFRALELDIIERLYSWLNKERP